MTHADNADYDDHGMRHDCPMVMTTGRHGNWVSCRCGWVSRVYEDRFAAQHEWALHVADHEMAVLRTRMIESGELER